MTTSLDHVTAKVDAGEPLTDRDVAALGSTRDIIALGMLATAVRRRLRGNEVTYVRVADLKISTTPDGVVTGVMPADRSVGVGTGALPMVGTAGSAATAAPTAESDGFAPDVVPAVTSANSAGEVRIFQTPLTLDAAIAVVEKARHLAADTPLSAFCLFELGKLPEGLPVVLSALRKAGLELVTQAPIDRLADPERALEALTDAGLQLARLTVNETPEREWTAVCREIAALQTRLRTIRAFAPLARKIDATQPTTGYQDVKRVAISRVLADNVDTIQVDWALYGPKLAQVALTFGADDIDSVSADDDDSHGRRRSPVAEIRRSIQAAGFEPVERDGKFVDRRSSIVDRRSSDDGRATMDDGR
jgi:aminodeoxyfutalosine synthase